MEKNKVEKPEIAYKQDKLSKIPSWMKILLLKYWVACAAFYFFGMGGAAIWYNPKDFHFDTTIKIVLVVGVGYSLFKEYIEKNFIRYMRTRTDDTYRYNMINLHGSLSFLLHFLYCMLLTILMAFFCSVCIDNTNILHTGYSGYGPFTVGAVLLGFDIIFIAIKDLIIFIVKKIKYNKALKIKNKIMAEDDIPTYGESAAPSNSSDNFTNDSEE